VDRAGLIQALSARCPASLASKLVDHFLEIRRDVATRTLGRAAPGKFVEVFVQVLRFLETGSFEEQPKVDEYLRQLDDRGSNLDDGLRICAARIARAMYTLRSKRNIAHTGTVDPNNYDLALLLHGAQWLLAELLRLTSNLTMEQAGALIAQVQAPIGGLVEDFGTRRIVLADLSVGNQILVLLHSHYPEAVTRKVILDSLDRNSQRTIKNNLSALWREKTIENVEDKRYVLTQKGLARAVSLIQIAMGS